MASTSSGRKVGILIGPGGIKGLKKLGFLLCAEQKGILERVNAYAAVSVGAFIALLLVAGYRVYDIITEATKSNLFEDISTIRLWEIQQGEGIFSQKKIEETLDRLIIAKYGFIPSMKELYNLTGIELYIVSTGHDGGETHPVYFSHKYEGDISCVKAALLSANIPAIFRKLYYKGKTYFDGALTDPYPIHLLDDGNRDVIGIHVSSGISEDDFASYLTRSYYSPIVRLRNLAIQGASSNCKHAILSHNTIDPIGIITTEETKIKMVTEGYEEGMKFFSTSRGSIMVSPHDISRIDESPI